MAAAGSGGDARGSERALEELCGIYWYPLYAYVRRHTSSPEDAADLTQAFFAQFIERDCLCNVSPEKGKFRAFLRVCLRRFLANQHRHDVAAKRGGGKAVLSIDVGVAEERYSLEPAHELTAEKVFERNWAVAVLQRALQQVEQEFAARGRQKVFETLRIYLESDDNAPTYAEAAAGLGMSETSVKVAVHRLRERYREAVEHEVAQTLEDGAALDDELRALMEALSV